MTLGERVEALAGTVSDKDWLSNQLSAGLRVVIDHIPAQKKREHSKTVSMNPTTGLALGEYSPVAVTRSGHRARPIPGELRARAADPNSLYYATDTDPIYYFTDELAKGLPATGTWSAEVIPYQDVDYGIERIPNFPVEYENLVVQYAAIGALTTAIEAERNALPTINEVGVPEFSWDASVPEDAVYLGSAFAQLAGYLTVSEDVELASAKLQEINTRLQFLMHEATKAHDAEREEWAAKLQKFTAEVGVGVQKMQFLTGQLAALTRSYERDFQLMFGKTPGGPANDAA